MDKTRDLAALNPVRMLIVWIIRTDAFAGCSFRVRVETLRCCLHDEFVRKLLSLCTYLCTTTQQTRKTAIGRQVILSARS
jgi:hypothetical protein